MEFEIVGHAINSLMPFIKAVHKDKDVRSYINCVHFRVMGSSVDIGITSGHFLARLTVKNFIDAPTTANNTKYVGIPVQALVDLKVTDVVTNETRLKFTFEDTECRLDTDNTTQYIRLSGANSPDFDKLIPAGELSGEYSHLNIELLALFASSWRVLMNTKNKRMTPLVSIRHNGPKQAARITFKDHPEFVGVLMPFVM